MLPFANLSDKENLYFTQGIQDEILTDLATIADLRVISRTSVMQYQPEMARDARAIGQRSRGELPHRRQRATRQWQGES